MTVVKELNELAEKMTGVNPKAKTDQQALNYIEQHYKGGDTPTPTPQSKFDYIIPGGDIYEDIGNNITNQDTIAVLDEIRQNYLDENNNIKPLNIGIYIKNDDAGKTGFCIVNTITTAGGTVSLEIVTNVDYPHQVTIHYDDGWKYYQS